MKILKNNKNNNILFNTENDFKTDLGWHENAEQLEKETLKQIINPIDNYETVRYIHEKYPIAGSPTNLQNDIWFYFYFINGSSYTNGLDYNLVGIDYEENSKMLRQSTESFFRLEFYKTSNNEAPERSNRRLVFSKNLSLPLGERYFYDPLKKFVYVPVFTGSNYRNKENMYLFWFKDDSAFEETNITGNTFWMTARFFNAKDGTILNFTNSGLTQSTEIVESRDLYYKVEINRTGTVGATDYSYMTYQYNGTVGNRAGTRLNPIKFYESFS